MRKIAEIINQKIAVRFPKEDCQYLQKFLSLIEKEHSDILWKGGENIKPTNINALRRDELCISIGFSLKNRLGHCRESFYVNANYEIVDCFDFFE